MRARSFQPPVQPTLRAAARYAVVGTNVAARRRSQRSSSSWAAAVAASAAADTRTPFERYAEACARTREELDAGRAAAAAQGAREALEALPRGLEAQRLLGFALLELGDARAARHAFEAALQADPQDAVLLVGLAEAHELLEGAGETERLWQRAWEADPTIRAVGERLQRAREAAGALDVQPGPPPLTRAALARIHMRGGLYEHAAIEVRAALAKDDDRTDLRLTLAEAYWRAGEPEVAAAVATEILERSPECVAANLLLAASGEGDAWQAGELMARVHQVDPGGMVAARLFDDRDPPAPLAEYVAGSRGAPADADEAGRTSAAGAAGATVPAFEDELTEEDEAAYAEPGVSSAPGALAAELDEVVAVEAATEAEAVPGARVEEVTEPVASRAGEVSTEAAEAHELEAEVVEADATVVSRETVRDTESHLAETVPLAAIRAVPPSAPDQEEDETKRDEDEAALAGAEPAELGATSAQLEPAAELEQPVEEPAEAPVYLVRPAEPVGEQRMHEAPAAEEARAATGATAAGGRAEGDAAMEAGRYWDALAAYGAWLRALRGEQSK